MKALVLHEANDLRFDEWPCPPVGLGEVLIRMAAGGICGIDLHYYNHGGFGAIRVREPIVLGHEVSGYIERCGEGVSELKVGQLVAVSPSQPCDSCAMCEAGMLNHCLDMRFLGSAMRFPHVQGAFREYMVVPSKQCVSADGLSPGVAAVAEPLAVCLHAAGIAGELQDKTVLVTGCGPIGALMIMLARHRGASQVIASDVSDFALGVAKGAGAQESVNVAQHDLRSLPALADQAVDVHFECSGAPGVLASVVPTIKPHGKLVQIGFGGDVELPLAAMTAKELSLCGSFRFTNEFPKAVALLRDGAIDPRPMMTHSFEADDAKHAFAIAGDRELASKVQINFD